MMVFRALGFEDPEIQRGDEPFPTPA